jgi:hypothetical protein
VKDAPPCLAYHGSNEVSVQSRVRQAGETLCRAIRYALGLRTRLLLSSIKYRKDSISVQIDLRAKGAVIPSHQLAYVGVPFDSGDMRMN